MTLMMIMISNYGNEDHESDNDKEETSKDKDIRTPQ